MHWMQSEHNEFNGAYLISTPSIVNTLPTGNDCMVRANEVNIEYMEQD